MELLSRTYCQQKKKPPHSIALFGLARFKIQTTDGFLCLFLPFFELSLSELLEHTLVKRKSKEDQAKAWLFFTILLFVKISTM